MTEFWPHSIIPRGASTRSLATDERPAIAEFVAKTSAGEVRLADYLDDPRMDGLIVLHEGRIAFEAYTNMRAVDRHLWMSVSKPVASLLVGILEDRGLIDVSKPVTAYLPEFAAGGWSEISVLDVLDMASGIDCRQSIAGAYTDPETCYYQFEAALGWLPATDATASDVHAWVGALGSARPAGEAFEYTSVNTFVLRRLVERILDKPYARVVSEEIWQQTGSEADAVLVAPIDGIPIASSGVSSTLRDMARFGLLFTPSGRRSEKPVVSDALLEMIQAGGRPEILNAAREGNGVAGLGGEPVKSNSYQWDSVMADGDFYKGGYGGQGLYVSPSRDLVLAFFGTLDEEGRSSEMHHIARQLATSGLFPADGSAPLR